MRWSRNLGRAGGVFVVLAGWAVSAAAGEPSYGAEKGTAALVLKTPDGRPMVRYVIGRLPAEEQPQTSVPVVGYLHPLYTPSGAVLTESGSRDGDHPWLRGVFLAWPQVDGPRPAGFWTCGQVVWKEKGQIVNREASVAADAQGASLSATNAWSDGQEELLLEKTTIHACRKLGVYVIDVQSALSAAQEPVQLQPWAFAGWTIHGRRVGDESARFYTPQGEVDRTPPVWNDAQTNWPDAPWYDLVLRGKEGDRCGVAMLGHPGNGATTWHTNSSLRFLNANVTPLTPATVEKTKPLVLRYRLVAHDGGTPTEVLTQLAAEFGEP